MPEGSESPAPIADLHCHYPMHVLAEDERIKRDLPRRAKGPNTTLEYSVRVRHRHGFLGKVRAAILMLFARFLNFRGPEDTWRVDLEKLKAGGVQLVYSVLYVPWTEIDLDEKPFAAPEDEYFRDLIHHLKHVEGELKQRDGRYKQHLPITTEAGLDAAIADGCPAIVHCIEGGFQLGARESVEAHVRELKKRGVVYITLAHLFWRGVAGNAPALPKLSDGLYDAIWCQPDHGLTDYGVAAVTAMYEQRILIDVSHMRQEALSETFALLRSLDKEHGREPGEFPVIATHAGFRFNEDLSYMLGPDTIREIADRDGVVGLIMAQHQLNHGLDVKGREDINGTVKTMCDHINEIHEVTGSHEHVGIGSDLDGFIKPTMAGINTVQDLGALRAGLEKAYPNDYEAILYGNADRVVRKALS